MYRMCSGKMVLSWLSFKKPSNYKNVHFNTRRDAISIKPLILRVLNKIWCTCQKGHFLVSLANDL